MHPRYFGLIAATQAGGIGNVEPWHLEYIAAAGVIVAGIVGLVTIWKHATNNVVRVAASAAVGFVVASGLLLAVGPIGLRLAEIRQRIARILTVDSEAFSETSFGAVQSNPSFNTSQSGGTGGPQPSPSPFYQQPSPLFYTQSNSPNSIQSSPAPPPESRSSSSPPAFGGSVTNPSGGSISNPTGSPK